MDAEAWVWSHYSLEPSAQKLSCPVRLTCLVCGEAIPYVSGESHLADHLRERHMRDNRKKVGPKELLPKKSGRPYNEANGGAAAFFEQTRTNKKVRVSLNLREAPLDKLLARPHKNSIENCC